MNDFSEIITTSLITQHKIQSSGFALIIIDTRHGAVVSEFFHNPDLICYPASSIKTMIALAALQNIDAGHGSLGDEIEINQPNANEECKFSNCQLYAFGKKRKIHELLEDTIIESNNISTNQLIDWVGKDNLNTLATSLGCFTLKINRKLYSETPAEPNITIKNTASARDLATLYTALVINNKSILTEKNREYLFELLGRIKHNDRLNGAFSKDIQFFHKTGSTSDSSSDAGFFYFGENRCAVLVGLQNFKDFESLKKIGFKLFQMTLTKHT